MCVWDRRDSMEAWLKLMEDGGPDSTRWLNVPTPFSYCHKPPPVFAEPSVEEFEVDASEEESIEE